MKSSVELKLTNNCNLLSHNRTHEPIVYKPEKADIFTADIVLKCCNKIIQ